MEINAEVRFYTVTEINRIIKTELEANPGFNNIWIKGEIYNLTYHSSGHIYFTLKDEGGVISAVFFRYANKNLKFRLEEGMSVLAYGGITVFEKRGSYQLNVLSVRPEGAGELQKRIEQLKKKLTDEGLFDPSRKRELPFLPSKIGIATSPTGAAVRDIIKVALRRFPNIEIVIAPAKVQGDDAAQSIVRAINELNRPELGIDLIIAGRGGGSFEDLYAFNEEIVVRAFAESPVPIISAVGHQIDHPLSDDAADIAAPTPSAAAELAIPEKKDLIDEIIYLHNRISKALSNSFSRDKTRLENIVSRKIFRDPYELVNYRDMMLNDAENRIALSMKHIISEKKERLLRVPDISSIEKRILSDLRHRFEMQVQAVHKLSPLAVMGRGYAIITDSENKIIKSVEKISDGDSLNIRLKDGRVSANVTSVIREK
ncbi:MAG TPA: exodeoxyribonuclease VII large subunit [Spirochaetota bacterium]|nr:exodeoxyribonuclease VII large subunit [Spirochaetota bacterium]